MDDDALLWIGVGIIAVLGYQAWQQGRLRLGATVGSSSAVPAPTISTQAGGVPSQPAAWTPTETDTGEPAPASVPAPAVSNKAPTQTLGTASGTVWRIPTIVVPHQLSTGGTSSTTPSSPAVSSVPHFSQVPKGYTGPVTTVPTVTPQGIGALTVPVVTSLSQIPSGGESVGGTPLGTLDQAVFEAAKRVPAGYTGYIHVPLPGGTFTDVYASGGRITVSVPTGPNAGVVEAIETG
jgi:hypothetical protein